MAQQLLHGADVVVGLQQVSGEAVTQGVAAHPLIETRGVGRTLDRLLNHALMQMVATHRASVGIHRKATRRKEVLPLELAPRVGVLARQGVG